MGTEQDTIEKDDEQEEIRLCGLSWISSSVSFVPTTCISSRVYVHPIISVASCFIVVVNIACVLV